MLFLLLQSFQAELFLIRSIWEVKWSWRWWSLYFWHIKGGFLSESSIHFSDLQISKKIFQKKTILSLKFKFQAQDSFLEYFFLSFGDLKNESNFLKKGTFSHGPLCFKARALPQVFWLFYLPNFQTEKLGLKKVRFKKIWLGFDKKS